MNLSPKAIRTQLALLRPLLNSCSLDTIRKGQEKLGEITGVFRRQKIRTKLHSFEKFEGVWCIPRDV